MTSNGKNPADRWLVFVVASIVLLGFTWFYSLLIARSPSHRTYGAFISSGDAANHHLDPYAVRPDIWLIHPYRNQTGPGIYDRNLQPPIMLPLFQLFARLSVAAGSAVWVWGSSLLIIGYTAALMVAFPDTAGFALILLLLLAEPTLSILSVGEDHVLFFAISATVVLLYRAGKDEAAAIGIGVLAALHPNFGLWIVLLALTHHFRAAIISFGTAALLTLLPAFLYGPGIYTDLVRAVRTDNHSFLMEDISILGFFTRAGYRGIGMGFTVALLLALVAFMWKRRCDPITLGGISICAGTLLSPLGWFSYLLIAFPCLALRKLDRVTLFAVTLMFIWDRSWFYSGHGFIGLSGTVHFFVACCLFFRWFLVQTERRDEPLGQIHERFSTAPGGAAGRMAARYNRDGF